MVLYALRAALHLVALAALAVRGTAIDLPGRSLVDAQISAEYVAYGVQYLAPKSVTGKVSIIGHSQGGGLNPQWALTFWPSIQPLVSNYISLAGDFQGTPGHVADHFSMIVDPAAYGLALLALEHGGPANITLFDKAYCTYFKDDVLFQPNNTVNALVSVVDDALAFVNATAVKAEPGLQPYVCQRGFASKCGPAF
ncbi:hypothetical protein RQP46_005261 [Phenoliferia psychrophenolica]